MKLFHLGIRTTEIAQIFPIEDNKQGFTTKYLLKNGSYSLTGGNWSDNVKAVEAALSAELYPDRAANADYSKGKHKKDRELLELWLRGDCKDMSQATRNALRRILEAGL